MAGIALLAIAAAALELSRHRHAVSSSPGASTSASLTRSVFLHTDTWVERPRSIPLGASAEVAHLRWRSWGGPTASATGIFPANNCKPTCAAGTIAPTPASVRLSARRRCAGRLAYTQVVVDVAHTTPPMTLRYTCSS